MTQCDDTHAGARRRGRYGRRDLLASAAAVLAGALVFPAVALAETVQKQWASCGKCRTIFFDGYRDKGHCCVGGGHVAGNTRVQLPYNGREGPRLQGAWRFCNKCSALFFDGYADKGVCPTGGGHLAQGYVFVLRHNIPGVYDHFRYCAKCHAMFERGAGHCPAGANHDPAGFLFDLLPENSQSID